MLEFGFKSGELGKNQNTRGVVTAEPAIFLRKGGGLVAALPVVCIDLFVNLRHPRRQGGAGLGEFLEHGKGDGSSAAIFRRDEALTVRR